MSRRLPLVAVLAAMALGAVAESASAATVYAPEYGTGPPETVARYSAGPGGSIAALAGSPSPVGPISGSPGGLAAMAFTPDGGRAVVGYLFNGGVQGLSVPQGGAPASAGSPMSTPSVDGLAVTPDGRFAYAPTRDFMAVSAVGILGYSISANGALTPIGGSPFSSGEVGDVAITPDGRLLYASVGAQIKRFTIGAGGLLSPAGTTVVTGPAFLGTSNDGRFLFAEYPGGGTTTLASYSIGTDGGLSPNGPVASTGTGTAYFAVAPDDRHVYVADDSGGQIFTVAVAADGSLSSLGPTPVAADSVAVSPDGRFLVYGKSGGPGTIGAASIGADAKPVISASTIQWGAHEPERLLFQPGPAPTAEFKVKAGAPGSASSFNASESTNAAHYDWDFGDGTTLTDGGPTPTHKYAKPGVYDVRLSVSDAQGCSDKHIYSGQSTSCPGGTATAKTKTLDTPPAIEALSVSRRKFAARAGRAVATASKRAKRGTFFRYRLSEKAKVTFTIERKRRKKFKKAGVFTANGKQGNNRARFSGKLGHRKLRPGSYRAKAVATDSAGGRSAPRSVRFRVVSG